jgi:hypothetical protein
MSQDKTNLRRMRAAREAMRPSSRASPTGFARSASPSRAKDSREDVPFFLYRGSDRVIWIMAIASRLRKTSMLLDKTALVRELAYGGADFPVAD